MNRLLHTKMNATRRKNRIRHTVHGSSDRPRLTVFMSIRHITAQIVNDDAHTTLAYVTTVGSKQPFKSMNDKAVWVGEEIAKVAKKAKVNKVVFDRNGRLYHGKIKALATKARESGLEF